MSPLKGLNLVAYREKKIRPREIGQGNIYFAYQHYGSAYYL